MSDEAHARELTKALREVRHRTCPQMRPACAERLYPVEGYCVLNHAPAWLMIPSIEEFRLYCTTPRFRHCPWFQRSEESANPDTSGIRAPLSADLWKPVDMPQPIVGV